MIGDGYGADPVTEASRAHQVLTTFRDYMLGPTRFMTLLSCFELGVVDALRESPGGRMTAQELAARAGAPQARIEQLLQLLIKDDFLSYDASSMSYALDGLAYLSEDDFTRILSQASMIKSVCLRQLYFLTESVKTGSVVGLKEFYGFDGTLYDACSVHEDLRLTWGNRMDRVTGLTDPWFFANVEISAGAKVLDLAGNTGLGAILTWQLKGSPGLHITCFDLPEKEAAALENFKAHGVEQHCGFVGGDVFAGLPGGFDVVLIKHFLDMFDMENVLEVLQAAHDALNPGGQICVLVPVYPEDLKSWPSADFFPAYFLGCTMGQGGPQKLSTYQTWIESSGFTVTKAIAEDVRQMPPDKLAVLGILCATKVDSTTDAARTDAIR